MKPSDAGAENAADVDNLDGSPDALGPAQAMEESSVTLPPVDLPIKVIEPSKGWVSLNLAEVWQYRELLYFFCWRDIKVRYKQTVLGASWAVLQPFSPC